MLVADYQITKLLGKGKYSEYYLTTKQNTNQIFVTRRIDTSIEFSELKSLFLNDLSFIQKLSHDNIIKMVDIKKTKNHFYIVMEYCNGGSLESNLKKYKEIYKTALPECVVQKIMKQIISAVNYLHNNKMLHRDLQLSNILVNFASEKDKNEINLMNAKIKISNFDVALYDFYKVEVSNTGGTPLNKDPRILNYFDGKIGKFKYDDKIDVWSMGILCYQMLVGIYPFFGQNEKELLYQIEKGYFTVPITLSREAISFLIGMLQYYPSKRLGLQELSLHIFILNNFGEFKFINQINLQNYIKNNQLYVNIKDNEALCLMINKEENLIQKNNNQNVSQSIGVVINNSYKTNPNIINNYQFIKLLGKGQFGEVYLAKKIGDNTKLYAAKKYDLSLIDPDIMKYLINEILIMKKMNHCNIVKFEDKIEKDGFLYLIMEYCNGGELKKTLSDYQSKTGRAFPEVIVQYLMRQIIEAFRYMHSMNIMHRDIKLDNILLHYSNEQDKNNIMKAQVKIIDFGFASDRPINQTAVGNMLNMDPLILHKFQSRGKLQHVGYNKMADIWSLGAICYELLIGKSVFDAQEMEILVEKVENGSYTVPTCLSKEVVSFLNGMLQYDCKSRLTCEQLIIHPFLTKNVKDFQNLDLKHVSNRVQGNNLVLNVKKKNRTIWAIFNREDELAKIGQLSTIPEVINDDDNTNNGVNKKFKRFSSDNNVRLNNNFILNQIPNLQQNVNDKINKEFYGPILPQPMQGIPGNQYIDYPSNQIPGNQRSSPMFISTPYQNFSPAPSSEINYVFSGGIYNNINNK